MSENFEELDYRQTQMGELILRRRRDPLLDVEIFEVKLNDDFLMSSLFTVAEIELARLGLAALDGSRLDIIVGGLGLGYTAYTVLEDPRVQHLTIIEALPEVIEWHKRGLVPLGKKISRDRRCRFIHADFFTWIKSTMKSKPGKPQQRYHAILLDIDHSPRLFLHPDHAVFYQVNGLQQLKTRLHKDGVFAMWSNDPPDDEFMNALCEVFPGSESHIVKFPNPYQGCEASATIYLARNS